MNGVLALVWLFVLYIIIFPLLFDYLLGKVSKDKLFNGLCAFVTSMILFIAFSFMNMHFREYEYWYSQDIVAMQDNETMLISRYNADSTLYYYFMVDNGDSYKSRRVDQNVSTIRYTDTNPELKVYKKESTNKFVYFFMPIKEYVNDYKYDFYVPEGTIKEEFNIDLE
jgi:hypothetical protein